MSQSDVALGFPRPPADGDDAPISTEFAHGNRQERRKLLAQAKRGTKQVRTCGCC